MRITERFKRLIYYGTIFIKIVCSAPLFKLKISLSFSLTQLHDLKDYPCVKIVHALIKLNEDMDLIEITGLLEILRDL